ncbi:MAG: NUDIX domain-containing protein [archaeon]
MSDFNIAVKAFIVKEGKVLVIKRRPNDPHSPGIWDIPGGRIEEGENPYDGLTREVKEEVNLEVNIKVPLYVDYFTRDDGQKITMLIFVCSPISKDVRLSEEHTAFEWVEIENAKEKFEKHFYILIDNYLRYFKK